MRKIEIRNKNIRNEIEVLNEAGFTFKEAFQLISDKYYLNFQTIKKIYYHIRCN